MPFDIVVYRAGSPWSTPWEDTIIEGFKAHGIEPEERAQSQLRVSDLAVIWAHRNTALFDMQRQADKRYLVMERGYIGDRFKWTSLGYDGLNGRADFCNRDVPADRWERHFADLLKPWKEQGKYVLLCGQVRGDASVKQVRLPSWYAEAAAHLTRFGLPIMFKPHPVEIERGIAHEVTVEGTYPLHDSGGIRAALADAALAVTYNSNCGVDAILAGVPVIACDEGSMVWPVAAHGLGVDPIRPDRTHWMARMAYCQWNEDEIASGEAWEHLKRGMKGYDS